MATPARSRTHTWRVVEALPTARRYFTHLRATTEWLLASIRKGHGGSCAYYSPVIGWSRPYPETTGYLISTLLRLDQCFPEMGLRRTAGELGEWLLGIQLACGAWQSGLFPCRGTPRPSIFNTGQVLEGLVALYGHTQDPAWLDAAVRAAHWLADGVNSSGLWDPKDYRSHETPSYYSRVAWRMLETWRLAEDARVREAAERVLRRLIGRRQPDGTFARWGFSDSGPAFTHTIAYTLRGFLESAQLLNDWQAYGAPTVGALETLLRRAELTGGRLAGAYDDGWKPQRGFSCLTGNAQVAMCLLIFEKRFGDLRIVNGAAKLIDFVCSRQKLSSPWTGIRAAVPGSSPLWGRYMFLRYPNWAAKFHCDAIVMLLDRLDQEMERPNAHPADSRF
jgi:hypothetical protein